MTTIDPVERELDRVAHLLESAGYAFDVDYAAATITIWTGEWPLTVTIRHRRHRAKSARRNDNNRRKAKRGG